MLTQVLLPCAALFGIGDHFIHRFKLVIAWEDQGFIFKRHTPFIDLLFLFHIDKAVKNTQPGITLANLFPEISHRVFAILTGGIARMAVVAFIERQEKGFITIQLGRHGDFAITHGKVNHRPAFKSE